MKLAVPKAESYIEEIHNLWQQTQVIHDSAGTNHAASLIEVAIELEPTKKSSIMLFDVPKVPTDDSLRAMTHDPWTLTNVLIVLFDRGQLLVDSVHS